MFAPIVSNYAYKYNLQKSYILLLRNIRVLGLTGVIHFLSAPENRSPLYHLSLISSLV
jgi:hypothetical protein